MVDFRVQDTASEHPKMRAAGPAAIGLWTMAGAYCNRPDVLSDGWVPQHYVMSWPNGRKLAATLVKVGLWREEPRNGLAGWQFHDWLDAQRAAEKIRAERESAKQRMARLRADGSKNVRPNKPRTGNEHSNEVPPRFTDSLSLSQSPSGDLGGEGYPGQRASARGVRPPERCPKHLDHPADGPCRDCGTARRAVSEWDTQQAQRRAAIREAIDNASADPRQRCEHGTDGGLFEHPDTGQSATCALCRNTPAQEAS